MRKYPPSGRLRVIKAVQGFRQLADNWPALLLTDLINGCPAAAYIYSYKQPNLMSGLEMATPAPGFGDRSCNLASVMRQVRDQLRAEQPGDQAAQRADILAPVRLLGPVGT
jgi:hypothetical protein